MLLKNLENSISGYFYKRKSYYFDKKDQLKSNFFSDLFQKIKFNSAKYDKRFFKLDINSFMFSYAKDEESLQKKPHYSTMLRNLVSVKRNIVSMPYEDKEGKIQFNEVNILDTTLDVDRGPKEDCQNVFELKVIDRMFTLYTHDNILMEKFVLYIEKILELKEQIQHRQR